MMHNLCLGTTSASSHLAPSFFPTRHRCRHSADKNVGVLRTGNAISASKSSGSPLQLVSSGCRTCGGKGAIECPGCKGTGKNKKNGNIFERWKCFDCQGFGLKSCPKCGKRGLTPEQRGER